MTTVLFETIPFYILLYNIFQYYRKVYEKNVIWQFMYDLPSGHDASDTHLCIYFCSFTMRKLVI